MKRLLDRIRAPASVAGGDALASSAPPSGYFSSMFADSLDDRSSARASWSERASLIGAQPIDRAEGRKQLEKIIAGDAPAVGLSRDERDALMQCFQFALVPSGREVITQDERGDFLLIVLDGVVAVDRMQIWGDRVSLGESRKGDVLGEMSLLDAGPRFSSCSTVKDTQLAVLDAASLDRLMKEQPRIALTLITLLARRMSLRLRHVSTRLTALLVRR